MQYWKKGLSLILALILLVGLVPVSALEAPVGEEPPTESVNLVRNGDFEEADIIGQTVTLEKYGDNRRGNTSNWQATGGVDNSACIRINPSRDYSSITKNAGVFITDAITYRLLNRTDKYHVLDVKKGQTYRASVDVWRPEGFKAAVRIGVENNGGLDFTAVTGGNFTATTGLGEGKWETITWEGTAKRDAQYLGLHVIVRETGEADVSAEGEYVLIDNVSFVCTTDPDQKPTWKEASSNLLVGGDFESEDLTYLTFRAAYESTNMNWYAEGGINDSAYIGVNLPAEKQNACLNYRVDGKQIGLVNGEWYVLSCDVRVKGGKVNSINLDFETFAYRNHMTTILGAFNQFAPSGEDWAHCYVIFQYTQNDPTEFLRLWGTVKETGGELQVDNMSLRCLSNNELQPIEPNLPTSEPVKIESVEVNGEDQMTVTFNKEMKTVGAWQHSETTFTYEGETMKQSLRLFGPARVGNKGGEVLFDNVSLKCDGEELLIGGDFSSRSAMMDNFKSDYEANAYNWHAQGAVGIGVPASGNACLKYKTAVVLEQGKTYTLSYDVLIPDSSVASITADFEDKSGMAVTNNYSTWKRPDIFKPLNDSNLTDVKLAILDAEGETVSSVLLNLYANEDKTSFTADFNRNENTQWRNFSAIWRNVQAEEGRTLALIFMDSAKLINGFIDTVEGEDGGLLKATARTSNSSSAQDICVYTIDEEDFSYDIEPFTIKEVKQTGAHTVVVRFSEDVDLVDVGELVPYVALRMVDPLTGQAFMRNGVAVQWGAESIDYYDDQKDALLVTFGDRVDIYLLASMDNMAAQYDGYEVMLCIEESPMGDDFILGNDLVHHIRRAGKLKQLEATYHAKAVTTKDCVLHRIDLIEPTEGLSVESFEVIDQTRIVITFSEAVEISNPEAYIRLVNGMWQTMMNEQGTYMMWGGRIEYYNDDQTKLVFVLNDSRVNNKKIPVTGLDDLFNRGYEDEQWNLMLTITDTGGQSYMNGLIDSIVSTTGKKLPADVMTSSDALYLEIDESEIPQGELTIKDISIVSDTKAIVTFSGPVEIPQDPWIAVRLLSDRGFLVYLDWYGKGQKIPMQWQCSWTWENDAHTAICLYISDRATDLHNFTQLGAIDWTQYGEGYHLGLVIEDYRSIRILDNGRVDNIRLASDPRIALQGNYFEAAQDAFSGGFNLKYKPNPVTAKTTVLNDKQIRIAFSSAVNIHGTPWMALRFVNSGGGLYWDGDAYNRTPVQFSGSWEWEDDSHTAIIWTMASNNTYGADNLIDVINYANGLARLEGMNMKFCIEEYPAKGHPVTGYNGALDTIVALDGVNHLVGNVLGGYDGAYIDVDLSPFKNKSMVQLLSVIAIDDQTIEMTFSEPIRIAEGEDAPTMAVRYLNQTGNSDVLVDGRTANFKGTISFKEGAPNVVVWKLDSKYTDSLTEIFTFAGSFRWNKGSRIAMVFENPNEDAKDKMPRILGITSYDKWRPMYAERSTSTFYAMDVELGYELPEVEVQTETVTQINYYSDYTLYIIVGAAVLAVCLAVGIVLIVKKRKEA